MNDLIQESCQPQPEGSAALEQDGILQLHTHIPAWAIDSTQNYISRDFKFKNYYETMAFVNAIAWVAHQEDHHPEITVTYNSCRINYSTHSVGGLSRNDFICAAKIDALTY